MEVSGKKAGDVLSASLLFASDDDVQLYCEPCDRVGSRVQAYGYCQDCTEHLCETCYKTHLKPAPLRNHVLLDSSKMPQSQQLSHLPTPSDLTENCQLHSGKVIEYYCRDHHILGCSPCITMNHRICKIDYIPDTSKNYDASQEYNNLLETLNTLHITCKRLAQLAKDNKKKIQENQDAIKEEIRKFKQEINRILDRWEIEAIRKVDQLLGEENVRVDSIDTESSKSAKEIEDLQNELKESQQSRKLNELFCKAKKNEDKMKDYATAITQMQENNYIKKATFTRNSNFERIIKTEKCLGEFSFKKDEASHVKMPLVPKETKRDAKLSVSADNSKGAVSSEPKNAESHLLLQQPQYKDLTEPTTLQQQASQQLTYDKISAKASGQIDTRVHGDSKNCDFTGIAVISRNLLAVTDYNNCKVKLVDTIKNEVSSLKMSTKPWDVAAFPGDQLAVTLPDSGIIQVLSTSSGLSKVKQLKVDGYCHGLAYGDGHFVVGFSDPGKVQIMTSEGKELRTIQYEKGTFLCPYSITIDKDTKTFLVADGHLDGRGIIRLNWKGKVTGVYKDSELNEPRGMLVLADGSLLVCYYDGCTIKLISPDFKKNRILLTKKDGLSIPQCVAQDVEQSKLYVGCEHNNLHLYKIK